mmetsp:Transcript_81235/g.118970  ORF Transcript_81235/g.118970 Transcript_81235/m.118970 type:complete len:239 (-) Transcript_81235:488-1204(-)
MLSSRPQILTKRHDFDAGRAQVAQRLHHLLILLTHTKHDAGLGHEIAAQAARVLKGGQALPVAGAQVAHFALQPLHSLNIVRVHIEPRLHHCAHAVSVALEVAHKRLDPDCGVKNFERLDGLGKVASTAILHVVTVYRGQHHVVQTPFRDGLGYFARLSGIHRWWSLGGFNVTKLAATRARVAHEHNGGSGSAGLSAPALSNVRALRLLAHCHKIEAPQRILNLAKLGVLDDGPQVLE